MVARTAGLFLSLASLLAAQPSSPESLPLSQVHAGQKGQVWTVFEGTKPEPFTVEVTGVVENALGPGKSLILCKLTDARVQNMGAVAGMSGSPLYIDGKFAGALSYQLQRFETVHYAGFTPAADMAEVADRVGSGIKAVDDAAPEAADTKAGDTGISALSPVFSLSGVSPRVLELARPQFEKLGLHVVSLGGSASGSSPAAPAALIPGDAVAVALCTGDISMAGTGTVSKVDGRRVVAFGHPMMGLGDVQMPMCSAEIVTILPSTENSFKVANVGPVIGCISEDRLSAVSGLLGPGPGMTDVDVVVASDHSARRSLHYQVIKDRRLAPMLTVLGALQAATASNDAEEVEGYKVECTVSYEGGQQVTRRGTFAGSAGLMMGLFGDLIALNADSQNPFESVHASHVSFLLEPLYENPSAVVEDLRVSRTHVRAGDTLQATVTWRPHQKSEEALTLDIPVDPSWTGKTLELIITGGPMLDEWSGHSHFFRPGQLRSFEAYLDSVRSSRRSDGLYVAVVERASVLVDEATVSRDMPGSLQRIATASDATRYQHREALVPLWDTHILPGRVAIADQHVLIKVQE